MKESEIFVEIDNLAREHFGISGMEWLHHWTEEKLNHVPNPHAKGSGIWAKEWLHELAKALGDCEIDLWWERLNGRTLTVPMPGEGRCKNWCDHEQCWEYAFHAGHWCLNCREPIGSGRQFIVHNLQWEHIGCKRKI